MKTALQELFRCLPLMWRGMSLVWRAARGWTFAWCLLLLVQGIIPAAQVYLTKVSVDRLTAALASHSIQSAFSSVWPPIILIAILGIVGQLLASLMGWVRTAQAELVQDHIHSLIHCQALNLDVAFFEQPDSYDLLHRARVDALAQPIALLESLGNLIQNGLTLVALAVMLAAYAYWLPLLLIGSALPGFWTVSRYILREHQWRVKNTSNERRSRYFDWMLTERGSVAEMRLFDLGDHHRLAFQKLRNELRGGRLTLARDGMKAELAAGSVAWLGALAGMLWMLLRAARGIVRLGDLVLCYQAFQQGQKLLRSLLESAGRIYRSTLFLENLFQFLEIKPTLINTPVPVTLPIPLRESIRFVGVTFAYPGNSRPALTDFSLTLPAGRVTAVVGHNGAGKSTLIKLLCRFYDPQDGKILLDGIDLRDLDISAVRRQITVLFQEPVHYHATAMENIGMGDIKEADDELRIRSAARAAGADIPIERLPQGYETVLGKWFGGAELSVGEWQRLALARAFYRNADLIVLDEPTSAMDSWAESEWLRRFRDLTNGHTALMITHRFTTAMHADIIHVMMEGRITESGTHKQLVEAGGHYAESWLAQMREMTND